MEPLAFNKLLRTIGIPLTVMTLLLFVIAAFLAYKNYLEVTKLRLQINALKQMKQGDVVNDD